MTFQLTPEQIRRLEAVVDSGRFSSVEEAVEAAIVGLLTVEDEDSDWIASMLDEARQSLDRGEGMSLEQFKARNAARRGSRNSG